MEPKATTYQSRSRWAVSRSFRVGFRDTGARATLSNTRVTTGVKKPTARLVRHHLYSPLALSSADAGSAARSATDAVAAAAKHLAAAAKGWPAASSFASGRRDVSTAVLTRCRLPSPLRWTAGARSWDDPRLEPTA